MNIETDVPVAASAALPQTKGSQLAPRSELEPTIYHENWWLDISSAGTVREVAVSRDGRVVARLPYVPSRHLGMVTLGLPAFVHFLGPAFAGLDGPLMHRLQHRHDLTRELIALLPKHDSFWQKLHYGLDDAMAFQADGFKASVQFSFEIEPRSKEAAWTGIRRGHRKLIREALTRYVVEPAPEPESFTTLYVRNVLATGKAFRYDADRLTRLVAAAVERGRGQVLFARDDHAVRAGMFIIWDHKRLYYFLATRERGRTDSRASVLLVWAAMEEACRRNLTFDFDGVYNAGQVMFYSGFGGRVSPRYIVSRSTRTAQLIYGLRGLTRAPKEHVF